MLELLLIVLLISLLLITTVRLFPLSPAPKSQTRVSRTDKPRIQWHEYHEHDFEGYVPDGDYDDS